MSRVVLIRRACWLAAAVSLAFGVWRSLSPDALGDFHRVVAWVEPLLGGVSPYAGDSDTDYPPWALLTLAPLVLVPASWQPSAWVVINLALAVTMCLRLVRHTDEPAAERRGLLGLLLASGCFRVLSQFSLLSFSLALVGAFHRSPIVGGLWMGLGLMKPQVGGVVVLAHLLMGDWRRVAIALVVPLALTLLAGIHTGVDPLQLLVDYAHTLERVHGGPEVFTGHTELEGWLAPLLPSVTTVVGALTIGMVLLVPVVVVARRRHAWPIDRRLELYALCGVVSLLATRHLSYDLVLVLPVIVAWRSAPLSVREIAQPWRMAWGVTAALMVLQIPGWWRRVLEPMGWPETFGLVTHLDRALCIALFGMLFWRLGRLNVTQ
jgi:hypothetical protein